MQVTDEDILNMQCHFMTGKFVVIFYRRMHSDNHNGNEIRLSFIIFVLRRDARATRTAQYACALDHNTRKYNMLLESFVLLFSECIL